MLALGLGLGIPFATKRTAGGASQPPVNLTPPTVTQAGRTLTVDPGDWSDATQLSYQWFRNVAAISGATGASYTGADTDWCANFQCRVTATNAGGSAQVLSSALYVGVLDVMASPPIIAQQCMWKLRRADVDAMQVRRDDNTPQSVGFDPDGLLNTTALLNFVGGGNAFVSDWNRATQGNASRQPRIVSAGVVERMSAGGAPALVFDGTDDMVEVAQSVSTQEITICAAIRANTFSDPNLRYVAIGLRGQTYNDGEFSINLSETVVSSQNRYPVNEAEIAVTTSPYLPFVVSYVRSGNTQKFSVNGVSAPDRTNSVAAWQSTIVRLGQRPGNSVSTPCAITESIVLGAALDDADRLMLMRNQAARAAVTLP